MRIVFATVIALGLGLLSGTASAEMSVQFTWGDIPNCTTGRPGIVPNPPFVLSGVPAGTNRLVFEMVDLDVPSYNHGGGRLNVQISGPSATIPPGQFQYRSPCPPGGTHTYQWTVRAQNGSTVLAEATATRRYPD